jgi:FkbM family methyltransferase
MKLAIIDIIGIPYDGTTVFKQGLGGSESAVVLLSRELAKIGFDVTVFNNCNIDHATPGLYDNVKYVPLTELKENHSFDIVISSRTVIPFTDVRDYHRLADNRSLPYAHLQLYDRIVSKAKMRILWMHDTFCVGDNLIEELAVSNRITDIFTLSDFHLNYVANCNHGRKRNFEVLKRKLFITRNGVHIYNKNVNIANKDKNLFVYNASVTKGMIPLVKLIWPHIKNHIPEAKLKVIGGYYRFSKNAEPDQQEKDWHLMAEDPALAALDIEFTGVISQKDIAGILIQANFMLYPTAFPETYGISSMESLCYNTPLVTCRFGALEEVAAEGTSYLIDYPIEPNSLFPDIHTGSQIEQFVKTTVEAYRNPYLHQQKQYYCNIVKEFAGWDSVALQWKQHFYKQTGKYLSVDEYRAVSKINRRIHKVYNRKYHNTVELESYKTGIEQPIVVVSTFYNCEKYIAQCIESIASQDYSNYTVYLINDASTDGTASQISHALSNLPSNIAKKFQVINNKENIGAVANQVNTFRKVSDPESIIIILDGDDSLINDNTIFNYYNSIYDGSVEFTYGSCQSLADGIPLVSQPYPEEIKQSGNFRHYHFNWILPYTHLRTFKQFLIDKCKDSQFKDSDGHWFKAGGDGAVFYSLIEAANPDKIKCLQDVVYNYNDTNPINDYKVNSIEQNKTAQLIVNQMTTAKKKILIAIPTAKNIEPDTFKSIYDLEIPEGYDTTFQFFYGYNIDQIRNLIADWVVKGFDYLFSVDSDIAFNPSTLKQLLAHDKDIVSGLYIQRKPGQHILELYEHNNQGGISNIPYGKIKGQGLVEIAGCGFGCVLVKAKVFTEIGYPQFTYHSALDHANTISEDIDFCNKARAKGFKLYADTNIQCNHIGNCVYSIDNSIEQDIKSRLRELNNQRLIPKNHVDYLLRLNNQGVQPKVIYDIGACVLHWTSEAKRIWPNAEFIAFEAMDSSEFLFKEHGLKYHIGVLSNETGKEVTFYQNDYHPGGNSYYKENIEINPEASKYFNDSHAKALKTITLDDVVLLKQLPMPDLIKMDVQGAELDILKGSFETLKSVKHVILELQSVEYNKGAPLKEIVIEYMASIGFDCLGMFSNNGPDGDYHFIKRSN